MSEVNGVTPVSGKAVRVAVIGAGYWGANVVRTFSRLNNLAAICEADHGKHDSLRTLYPGCALYDSPDEVFRDPGIDAVSIAAPAALHEDLVRQALLCGKDVLVEKPLCLSADKGRGLVDLAAAKGRILMVGHLLWYHPAVLKLKELVEQGELGRLQYICSNRLNLGKIRREENILWSFAPHDISLILGLLGETPSSIQAQAGYYLHEQIADVTVSFLSFPSGAKAHLFVSWLHPYKEQKLVVIGDRKMAVFDDLEEKDKLLLFAHSIDWQNNVPVPRKAEAKRIAFESREPLMMECEHFLDCVATRRKPRTDGAEGLRVLKVLEQCQSAIEREHTNGNGKHKAAPPAYFAHESAFIDDGVKIGEGTTIWHVSHIMKNSAIGKNCRIGQNVVVGPDVSIGDNVKIQNNVCVYEGVTLEDNVFCGPSMVFTNVFNPRSEIARMDELRRTLVKEGATLGANCTIICGTTVGRYAFVAAGAVVTKEVPDHALVMGNPAQIKGWMCRCGVKVEMQGNCARCPECGTEYEKSSGGLKPLEQGKGIGAPA